MNLQCRYTNIGLGRWWGKCVPCAGL